jgi:ABC-type multidrug transport system ATPase subunit
MKDIVIQHISKRYGTLEAVRDVSLHVTEGELFGLIGPDGAGKTSLLRVLASLLLPDGGSAQVAGFDVVREYKQVRKVIGYMPGRFSLYPDLSIAENLEFFAAVFGTTVRQHYDLIAPIYQQIEPFKNRRAGALSGGMKQKLALCCALIHKPLVLLLDEPGTGVDPVSRQEFWDMLGSLRQQGLTMLVSTPNMDEAAKCDRVALMQHGQILALDTPGGVVKSYQRPLFAVRAAEQYRLLNELRGLDGVHSCYAFGEYAHVAAQSEHLSVTKIQQFLQQQQHSGIEVQPIAATIEDCFIELTA